MTLEEFARYAFGDRLRIEPWQERILNYFDEFGSVPLEAWETLPLAAGRAQPIAGTRLPDHVTMADVVRSQLRDGKPIRIHTSGVNGRHTCVVYPFRRPCRST